MAYALCFRIIFHFHSAIGGGTFLTNLRHLILISSRMAFLDFTYKLLQVIRNSVGVFVLIVIFYILQYIFNMHFLCSCKPGLHPNGVLYMALPPLILAFIVIIVEPFHQRKIFYWCNSLERCFCCFCSYFCKVFVKWIGLAAVWIAAVLFDGDWFVCLMTNLNKNQTGIPCKQNLTYEEQRIIGDYMTKSLVSNNTIMQHQFDLHHF